VSTHYYYTAGFCQKKQDWKKYLQIEKNNDNRSLYISFSEQCFWWNNLGRILYVAHFELFYTKYLRITVVVAIFNLSSFFLCCLVRVLMNE